MLVRDGTMLQRVSWTGILAGLLAGVVTQSSLVLLGLAIGLLSATDGLGSLGGIATRAAIWIGVSLLVSAFVAGLTAARAAGYLTPAQGRFNGLLTGMLLLIVTAVFTFNTLLAGVNRVIGIAGSAVNTVAGAASSAAGLGAAGLSGATDAITSGLSEQELNRIIADAAPDLGQAQVSAASAEVRSIIETAAGDIGDTAQTSPSDLPALVTRRINAIEAALQGDQFASRLEARGLTAAQAQEVTTVVNQRAGELRLQAETTVAQAGETANEVTQAAAATGGRAAWGALLVAGLVLGLASFAGGMGSDLPAGGVRAGRDEVLVEKDLRTATRNDPS